jgi:hypothetical protein
MRSTPSARVSGAPRLPLALAASLFALGALVSSARAETMPTRDTMDSGADMLSAFARYEMDDAVIDLFDAETGVKLSAKSVAAVADSSPFDDQNDFDLGLFVTASDGKFEPGQTVNVSVCDFGAPDKCVKAEPYKGAPESYECGASDELLPETDFRCVDVAAETDEDGDLSLIEMDVVPVASAACAAIETEEEASEDADLIVTDADEDTEDEDNSEETTSSDENSEDEENSRRKRKTSRRLLDGNDEKHKSARRKLAQARQASVRRRAGRSSRSVRAGGARGFTGGRARRGRSRGRG